MHRVGFPRKPPADDERMRPSAGGRSVLRWRGRPAQDRCSWVPEGPLDCLGATESRICERTLNPGTSIVDHCLVGCFE